MTGHVEFIAGTAALLALVRAALAWQGGLSFTELRIAHVAKCYAFRAFDPLLTRLGRPLINGKHYNDADAEYVGTERDPPKAVAKRILSAPRSEGHLVATAKRRETPAGTQFAYIQLRIMHEPRQRDDDAELEPTQTEIYLFPTVEEHMDPRGNVFAGGTDAYAHVETSPEDPEGHLTDEQLQGDALGAFAEATDG